MSHESMSNSVRVLRGCLLKQMIAACLLGALLYLPVVSVLAADKDVTLQDAIKARTDLTVLMMDAMELTPDVRDPMRKLLAKADGKQMEGNIFLTKDKYAESVKSFKEAAELYRKALDGKKVLERLAQA